ncbi:MAG: hypothetical protein PHW56_05850 [Methanosarcinaceae archaeon]|nr:hypothetical protein [Methanosarcinaceae archaeon]
MIKFSHLLLLSALMVWLIGSGCVDNEPSEIGEIAPETQVKDAGGETGDVFSEALTESEYAVLEAPELLELESDMAELEALLEDMSLEEEIIIEDL